MERSACADFVLKNGRILTMDAGDRAARAVAIRGERIAAVGSEEEILPFVGRETEILDLKGATVLPGLIDTHAHFSRVGSLVATSALLYDCTSIEEVIARLIEHEERIPDGAPILGRGDCFFETHFAEGRQVCALDLDRVATDRPVVISDVNKTIVNSYAIDHCVACDAALPHVRLPMDERTGRPTGVFFSAAREMVETPAFPMKLSPKEAVRASSAQFAAHGVTTVADPGPGPEFIRTYCAMGDAGDLSTRVVIMPSTHLLERPEFCEEFPPHGAEGPCYRFGPAKQFYDRFVMHRTAYMYEAYPGEPENFGSASVSLEELRVRVERTWAAGWPLGIHVTGDRALAEAARVMAEVCRPTTSGRSHSIHAYFPTPEALRIHRDADLGVAVQPAFLRAWGETLKRFLGEGRASGFLPLRIYLKAGVIAGGGSDAPIVHWNPFRGMATAVDRETLAGQCLDEGESLTSRKVLALYTRRAAQILDMDGEIGSIEVGKRADLIVVDRDVLACSSMDLPSIRVELTMVDGRIVYRRDNGQSSSDGPIASCRGRDKGLVQELLRGREEERNRERQSESGG